MADYEGTVIVVSHDRHFLNQVCTHIADIDFGKIQMYVGNYDFWYESSQLALKLMRDENKKKEDKIKELQAFIQRFSAPTNPKRSKRLAVRSCLIKFRLTISVRRTVNIRSLTSSRSAKQASKSLLVEGLTQAVDGEKV